MKKIYYTTKFLLKKYERILLPLTLFVGFIIDSLTLNRADQIFDNLVLLFYILVSAISIALIYSEKRKITENKFYIKYKHLLPYLMQFALGGLFSGLVVFYIRSGTILTSLPFIFILIFLLISNEFIHQKYPLLTFRITILYIAIFSYSILITPILIGSIDIISFILGVILSLIIILFFIYFLMSIASNIFKKHQDSIYKSISIICIVFIFLYITNAIPPIPLSLKQGGIYHSVIRTEEGNYLVQKQKAPWYSFFKEYDKKYEHHGNDAIYAFSSVFAPTTISGTIFHEWSYYDENKKRWIVSDKIPLQIFGGRDGGYRGYTFKSNIDEGLWRVDITNKKGQIIGRLKFTVENVNTEPELITKEI